MTNEPVVPTSIHIFAEAKDNGSTYSVGQGTQNVTHHHHYPQGFVGPDRPSERLLADPSSWPRVGDGDALLLGVHRAPEDANGNAVPSYVRRDFDERLRGIVGRLSSAGGMVLLVGDSTAGKTRSAFEAVSIIVPSHRLVAPSDEQELQYMAEVLVNSPNEGDSNGCVLWLDDLERFLDPVALTPTMLAALVQRSIIVVATMQARFYRTYVAKKQLSLADDDDQKHMSRVSAQVVESFTILFLNRLWSKTELLRANEASDPRVLDAVRHGSEYGVAEYLAAGPQLLREWQSAWAVGTNPRGAAIVAAAVDCARTGVNRNLSASLIRELHHHYLRERGGRSLRPESEEEAFEWATQLRHGTTSLLTSVGSGTYRVFDYLPDAIDRDAGSEPVPDQVWLGNLNHARVNPCKCCVRAIGRAAINQQRPDIAWTAWHAEAESGDSEAAYEIGMLLEKKGDLVGAEAWYRRSSKGSNADAMHNLAFLVRDGGDEAGALDWWKRAVEAGNLHAAFHLGWHQERNGNNSTAEKYYRKAALGGDGHACFHIGVFAERRSDFAEAEGWYRQAVELGDLGALNNLGVMLQKKGDLDGAEKCWREAFAEGDVNSAWNLGMLFLDRGKQADCWKWLQQAARKQHPMAMDAVKKIGDLDDWGVGSDFAP